MNLLRWLQSNKSLLSVLFSLLILYCIFDLLWALVIIATIYLVDKTLNIEEPPHLVNEHKQQRPHKIAKRNIRRPYIAGVIFSNNKKQRKTIDIQSNIQERRMFFNNSKKLLSLNENGRSTESKPSLMSLIHRGRSDIEENLRPTQQPLLAVVKNHMHLRHPAVTDSSKKIPLYKTFRSPVDGVYSPAIQSPNIHNTSYGRYYNSPNIKCNAVASHNISYHNTSLNNSTNSTHGLEVHGSYFVNKSLLHDEDVHMFSLVNKNFNSPRNLIHATTVDEEATPRSQSKQTVMFDETSTEAVVSALKAKSKRKRQHITDSPQSKRNASNSKKLRFSDNVLDSTLNDLFPPILTTDSLLRKKISTIRSSQKRLVSTSTQYESSSTTDEDEVGPKKMKKDNSKFGLTVEQTDEMMDETNSSKIPENESANNTAVGTNELGHAVEFVKESLKGYAKSSTRTVSFNQTPTLKKKSEELEPSINKKKVLKNLKSPYKKIFNSSIVSQLTPGSAEKLRKYPIYFTAKIDIDEIQNNREEYGIRGASLKAFRHDQQAATKRANDLFDEADEVDFKKTETVVTGTTLFNAPVVSVTSTTPPLLSSLKAITTTSSSTLTQFGSSLTKRAGTATPITQVISNATSLSQVANTATPLTQVASTLTSLTNISSATNTTITATTTGFSFPTTLAVSSSICTIGSVQNSVSFAFNTQAPSTFTLTSAPTAVTSLVSGFSFGAPSTLIAPQAKGLQFTSTAATTNVFPGNQSTCSFGASSSVTTNVGTSKSLPSFSFGTATSQFPVSVASIKPLSAAGNVSFTTTQSLTNTSILFGAQTSTVTNTTIQIPATTTSANLIFTTITTPATTVASIFGSAQAGNASLVPESSKSSLFAPPATTSQTSVFGNTSAGFTFGSATTAASGFNFSATTTQVVSTKGVTSATPTLGVFAPSASSNKSLFGSNSQNIFGAPISSTQATPNIFAAPQNVFSAPVSGTTASVFGAPASSSTSNVFGVPAPTAAVSSIYGASAPCTSATSVFGAPVPSTASSSVFGAPAVSSVFGAPASVAVNMFGTQPPALSSNIFNAPASNTTAILFCGPPSGKSSSNNLFGAAAPTSSQSIFGTPASSVNPFGSATSLFGQPTTQSTSGFQFGATSVTTTSQANIFAPQPFDASSKASVFGQQTANTFGASSNVFGAANNNTAPTPFGSTPATNPFGQQQSTGFDFSASLKQGPSINFGGPAPAANAFGTQPIAPSKSFNFSAQPSTPNFGDSASPSFGTPTFGTPHQSTFGTPQQSTFGTPQQPAFGTPSTGFAMGTGCTNPPANRQTTRARRRLKR